MNIDASFLRPGYQSDRKEGFYAEFNAEGQLTHLGYYENGKPQGWALYLEPSICRGRLEKQREFSAEVEGQDWEYGDYSTGRERSEADLFRSWVQNRIQEVYESADRTLRCSFCGKGQTEVAKLIAGPQVFICNECIDLCNEIIAEEQSFDRPPG